MEQFLNNYIQRMQPFFPGFPAAVSHDIASAFLAYRFGLYANAVRECDHVIFHIPEGGANNALKKALTIVRANAQDRDNSQVTADTSEFFLENEKPFIAIILPSEKIEDPGTINLDNALILTYVVALITSREDEEALEEHRRFIVRLLTDYKKALGFE